MGLQLCRCGGKIRAPVRLQTGMGVGWVSDGQPGPMTIAAARPHDELAADGEVI